MKSRLLPNGLSRRINRCLALAGIPINKPVIIRALKSGKLYPFHWPPNYGQFTHFEDFNWSGLDGHMRLRIVPEVERRLSVEEELEAVLSANLQRAACLRQSILQKAFTGKLT